MAEIASKSGPAYGLPIRIETDGISSKIYVDGTDITQGVHSYRLEHVPGELPTLHLEMIGQFISVDATLMPELPDLWKPYYRRKGKDES